MNYPAVEIPKLAWQGIDIETGHAMTSTRLMVKQSFYSGFSIVSTCLMV